MTDVMLQSSGRGAWGYEFGEGKNKEAFSIEAGVQTIPESHMKMLRQDPGFKERLKKEIFKELKPAEIKKNAKADQKALATEKEIEDFKKDAAENLKDTIELWEGKLKTQKNELNIELQNMVELRAADQAKVSELEEANLKLVGQLETVKADSKLESDVVIENLTKDSNAAVEKLTEEIVVLKKQVKTQAEEIKKLTPPPDK